MIFDGVAGCLFRRAVEHFDLLDIADFNLRVPLIQEYRALQPDSFANERRTEIAGERLVRRGLVVRDADAAQSAARVPLKLNEQNLPRFNRKLLDDAFDSH